MAEGGPRNNAPFYRGATLLMFVLAASIVMSFLRSDSIAVVGRWIIGASAASLIAISWINIQAGMRSGQWGEETMGAGMVHVALLFVGVLLWGLRFSSLSVLGPWILGATITSIIGLIVADVRRSAKRGRRF